MDKPELRDDVVEELYELVHSSFGVENYKENLIKRGYRIKRKVSAEVDRIYQKPANLISTDDVSTLFQEIMYLRKELETKNGKN
jgi:hypothetical protein